MCILLLTWAIANPSLHFSTVSWPVEETSSIIHPSCMIRYMLHGAVQYLQRHWRLPTTWGATVAALSCPPRCPSCKTQGIRATPHQCLLITRSPCLWPGCFPVEYRSSLTFSDFLCPDLFPFHIVTVYHHRYPAWSHCIPVQLSCSASAPGPTSPISLSSQISAPPSPLASTAEIVTGLKHTQDEEAEK